MTNEELRKYFISRGMWSDQSESRFRQPYDGLLGMVPEWFPEENKMDFWVVRENLLNFEGEYTLDKLREFINTLCRIQQAEESGYYPLPKEIRSHITKLTHYQFCTELEDIEVGLNNLGGKDAVKINKLNRGIDKSRENRNIVKERNKNKFLQDCLKIKYQYPRWKLGAVRKKVAEINGCSLRTVERHTPNLDVYLKKHI